MKKKLNGWIPTDEELTKVLQLIDEPDGVPDPTPEQTEASFQRVMTRLRRRFFLTALAGALVILGAMAFTAWATDREHLQPSACVNAYQLEPGKTRGCRGTRCGEDTGLTLYTPITSEHLVFYLSLPEQRIFNGYDSYEISLYRIEWVSKSSLRHGSYQVRESKQFWKGSAHSLEMIPGLGWDGAVGVYVPAKFLNDGQYSFVLDGVKGDERSRVDDYILTVRKPKDESEERMRLFYACQGKTL